MTLDEFNEYAKTHDYVIFTKQQYEHVIDVFNHYELLLLDYYGRLKVDMVATLGNIRAEIETKYGQCKLTEYIVEYDGICTGRNEIGDIADILQIIDKYKADPVSREREG